MSYIPYKLLKENDKVKLETNPLVEGDFQTYNVICSLVDPMGNATPKTAIVTIEGIDETNKKMSEIIAKNQACIDSNNELKTDLKALISNLKDESKEVK